MKHPVFEVLGKDAGKLCQLRRDFRNFRLDRIAAPAMLDETFEDEAGKSLRDMLARYGPDAVGLIDG